MARIINKSVIDTSIYNIENPLVTRADIKNTEKWSNIEQWEPGVVLDIILDDKHPLFGTEISNVSLPNEYPANSQGNPAKTGDKNYGDVGMIFVRLCYSQQGVANNDITRAYPLHADCTSYPLMNEVVNVISIFGNYYYTNRINCGDSVNSSADFRFEQTYGFNPKNQGIFKDGINVGKIVGPISTLSSKLDVKNLPFNGVLGRYFWFNNKIRSLKRNEGDTIIESRFGQSVRFGAYDGNRMNDKGGYEDYKDPNGKINLSTDTNELDGGGNPMILIRNRQRPVSKGDKPLNEVNVGGYIEEDINNDGSSVHITSGLTKSKFTQTTDKAYFSKNNPEEQLSFSPTGCTPFKFPVLTGDQIVINSDRLVFSSKAQETIHFSKKRYMVVTDEEYTVDADKQIVLTTNHQAVINAPAIYLGEYNNTNEPAILGQTCVDWLYDLCNIMIEHTHWYAHKHPNTGREDPATTQMLVQLKQLKALRDSLHTLLSRRVFLTGGGYAPGANGGKLNDSSKPVTITKTAGELSPEGMPGGWQGRSRRLTDIKLDDKSLLVAAGLTDKLANFINNNITTMSEADLANVASQIVDKATA